MTTEFTIGEHVRAPCGTALDPHDKTGTVVAFRDWWIMVRMDKSGIRSPFMAGELEHARRRDAVQDSD